MAGPPSSSPGMRGATWGGARGGAWRASIWPARCLGWGLPSRRTEAPPLARGAAGRGVPVGARRVAGAHDAAGAGGGDGAERVTMRNSECGMRNVRGGSEAERPCTAIPNSAFRTPQWRGGAGGQGMIRIIAGEFKGRRLKTPAGDAVRPTGDRVREAWFSILQRPLRGARVLDLFAGSVALGLEPLSRGAVSADFVEIHRLAMP